ncbi:mannosyltransferase putative-domain-containing protein [Podospora fimiseda]|uniref:Mannosyltransferase putative-domain-containing protein n=1 Tax=Podospora fimiseda TaxID=252190 RepID=A0AAN7GY41_9PEZI|nr:mannosyltransferase putative-domain-containing protein [Podospora fimiseda]
MIRLPYLLSGRTKVLLILFLPFLTFIYFIASYGSLNRNPPPQTPVVGHENLPVPTKNNNKPSDWWIEFFSRFEKTRPRASPLKFKDGAGGDNWKPDTTSTRASKFTLNDRDLSHLTESHAEFISQLPSFARHLPYNPDTTGIVAAAGIFNFGQVISTILTTRRAGSKLPIEIIVDSSEPWIDHLCTEVLPLPQYNAHCVYLQNQWAGMNPFTPTFKGFQWKFIAMVASSFQNVLYFDADILPIHNPDPILTPKSEPYASTGFITYPDFWTSTISPYFYHIVGDLPIPPLTARPSSESGIMFFDKKRHADTILLASYYNYNGLSHYYPMLSQHAPGEGDKETFLQAALVLEGLRKKGVYQEPTEWMVPNAGIKKGYWDVKRMPVVHGRTNKGEWRGAFMQQMDPMEDYRVVMKAIKEDEERRKKEKTLKEINNNKKGRRSGRVANGRPFDTTPFHTDSSFLENVGNLTLKHDDGRFMFFHNNGIKPDFARIKHYSIVVTNEDDKYIRLWGDPGWIIKRTGRDVEKDLWLDSQDLYCNKTAMTDVCQEITKVVDQIFV